MIRTLLFSLLFCSTILAQSIPQKITTYLQSYVDNNDFTGCVLITESNDTLYEQCFGYADIAFKIPNSTVTRFKIGSISKQFTAVAILKLEEAGKLSVDDHLSDHLEVPDTYKEITIHQLLTHQSGTKDIFSISDFSHLSTSQATLDELVTAILSEPLNFEAGSEYEYSNGGYAILAKIIEEVSGESFRDYLKNALFNELELTNTGHFNSSKIVENLAEGYDPDGLFSLQDAQYIANTVLTGSGSLYSTNRDLKKWINALNTHDFLSDESREKLFTNHINNYGYGISLYTSFGRSVFGHDGRISGYIADYLHYSDEDITVIITGNVQTGVADYLRRDLAAILFGEEYESWSHTFSQYDRVNSNLSDLVGSYSFGPNFIVNVIVRDNKLLAQANEGGFAELVPVDSQTFFTRTLYSSIAFQEKGEDVIMVWTNNDGNSFNGVKIKSTD